MSDRTPLFRQCVSIIETSDLGKHSKPQKIDHSKYIIKDTFVRECLEVKSILSQLNQFIDEIRSSYFEVYDKFKSSKNSLTINDKDKIDEDFQFKIQEILRKLKFLQNYEKSRQEAHSQRANNGIMGLFKGDQEEDMDLFWTTISAHRTSILKSLNETANSTGKKFDRMQKKRYAREKQISMLNFQDLDEDLNVDDNIDNDPWQQQIDIEFDQENNQQYTQMQLKELDTENQEFLAMKTNQLEQVEKLRNSMADIVNLSQELSFQLNTQSEKLDSLLENQDQIDADIRLGNKNLNQATSRNKAGTRIIVITSIVAAFLILFLDYIS